MDKNAKLTAIAELKDPNLRYTRLLNEQLIDKAVEKINVSKGEKGDIGATGAQGIQGSKGDKGDQGPQGIAGKNGINGLNGNDGKNGLNGKDGINGKDADSSLITDTVISTLKTKKIQDIANLDDLVAFLKLGGFRGGGGSGTGGTQFITSLTTTGSSGPATVVGGVLNVPQYSGGGTPGGLNAQLQYNNNGAFGGITGATTDGTAVSLNAPHLLNPTINGAGTGLATLTYPNTSTSVSIALPATSGTVALTSQLTAGTVTSVSGTTNRITSTGGTTPVIDISSTFEALLGKVANPLSQFASTTSAQLAGIISDETGSGALVFATSPTLTTAILGSSTATTQTPADNSTKVATTAYVDAAVLGQNFKEAALVATTANLVGTYVAGVFTYTATGTDTIDGVTLALGNRVLVKNQTTTFQNGIYSVTTAGALGVAGVLTRTTDANSSTEFKTGDSIFVTSGTANSNTTWAYTGIDNPTIGTTAITYAQTAGQGTVTAGNGITVTGLSVAIDTSVTVDLSTAQTLTNKTLTSPVINSSLSGTAFGTGVTTFLKTPSSANLAAAVTDETGTGNLVFSTLPTLTTPIVNNIYFTPSGTASEQFYFYGKGGAGIPVPFFYPNTSNTSLAFDISPNGTPGNTYGIGPTWIDLLSTDVNNANYEVLRMSKRDAGNVYLTSAQGGTGSYRDMSLQYDFSTSTIAGKVGIGLASMTANLDITPSTTGAAALRIRSGSAPTSPNSGDMWFDGTHLQYRIGTTTYQLDQQSGGGGSGTVTSVATDATLTGGPITTTGTLGINLANANTWTAAQVISSTSAAAFVVGPNGTTNPVLQINASTASQVTGVMITGNVLGSAPTIAATSSGSNENLNINSKGSGVLVFNSAGANVSSFGNFLVQKNSATAFVVGPNGTTNPTIQVVTNTTSAATGISLVAAAAGAGMAINTTSSGTNENLNINAKGSGIVNLANVSTGGVSTPGSFFTGTYFGVNTSIATISGNTWTAGITSPAGTQNIVSLIRPINTVSNLLQFVPNGGNTTTNVNWFMGTFASSDSFSFGTYDGGASKTRFSISDAGLVSIGTATPSALLTLSAGIATANNSPLKFTSGTNLTTAEAGSEEYDGTVFYATSVASSRQVVDTEQIIILSSAYTLTSQTAAQKLFNSSTNGALTVAASTAYEFECFFSLTAMSTTSGSFGFAFGGTATFTSQTWDTTASKSTLATPNNPQTTFNTTANTTLVSANLVATGYARIRGTVRINAAGTLIPQVSLGVAAAAVVGSDSYFRIWPVGSNTVSNVGNWS